MLTCCDPFATEPDRDLVLPCARTAESAALVCSSPSGRPPKKTNIVSDADSAMAGVD